ncbi:hypothetical protein FEMY_24790 [Ferrovum myxofaciens]|uniref:Uncharacterized protein n=1 Tax=Ferrovum myxofaciens TaxID=416213 RepID=A0A149VUV9_9PROT|nr:hypothetical protein FEMY_24790 [Ferrovum myxofaciens]
MRKTCASLTGKGHVAVKPAVVVFLTTNAVDGQLCTVLNPPQRHLSIGVKLFKHTELLLKSVLYHAQRKFCNIFDYLI